MSKIVEVDVEKEMRKSYLDYSMSVIVGRALPDVRDGLKPVHRRILYTMYENSLNPDKPYRKCADTVGAVLGRYHPHGDSSVYDALVRMPRIFLFVILWWTAMATLVRWTETLLPPIVIQKRGCPKWPFPC